MTTPQPERLLLSIEEVRDVLGGLARSYIYTLIVRGEIASVKVGRQRLVPRKAVEDFVQRLREEADDDE